VADDVSIARQARFVPLVLIAFAAPLSVHPATARAADTTPPTVSIASPSSGTVGGVVQVMMLASDNVGVTSVSLRLDGSSIGTALSPPYFVNWNTTTASNGSHKLLAEAFDGAGNRGTSDTLNVAVQNPAFVNEVVVPGITSGLTVAFLPDGRMLVGDLTEKIWVVHPGSSAPQPTPFLQLNPSGLQGEQGLMEVIPDPNFATNHWYYVYYTHTTPNENHDRVSRFTASGDTTVAGSELLLWENDLNANLEHHGGGLAFGPGGKLFISVGEAFYADDAQRLDNYRGKLLRINPDGSIPPGNPFADGAGPNKDEIYAYGLRNPTRMSYDSASGRLFISDVGGNDGNTSKEEINLAVAGANYGWPLCEGACGTPGLTSPLYEYPHAGRDAAVMCGFVYRGGTFPSAYQGSFFFGDYAQNWIRRLTFDTSGNLIGAVNFEPPDGSADGPYGDIVKILQGPDGALYYVDIGFNALHEPNEAAVRRIRYVTNDLPPVAAADASPRVGAAPLTVTFSSAGSSDPEGHPLGYSWDFGDNTSSTAANPTHTYVATGMYTARLTVSDGTSSTLSNAIIITVGSPPTVQIQSPVDESLFRAGDVIPFAGTGTDGSGNPLPASAYSWAVVFHHDSHVHPGGSFPGVTSGSFSIPTSGHDFSDTTSYEFSLTVTDANGLTASKSVTIYPDKVNLPFSTQPGGLSVDVGGVRKVTPFVLDALKGFQYTINAPAQVAGGQSYDFVSWSDGGPRSHTIVVPDHDSSWVAAFTALTANGLVGAYPFEEGNGTTTADRSGFGNNGTLAGATWTSQGRFGGALQFNGTSSMVTVPDSPSLRLTSAMTLEAWVYPTVLTGGWTDVIMKQTDNYYLAATAQPGGVAAMGSSIGYPVYAGTPLPANTWSHLAATYDGVRMCLYVNGIEVNSRAETDSLPTSSGPLSFGGDAVYGQRFTGRIDEVRIYRRALTPSEIQSDMTAPVITGVEAADPSPPKSSALLGAVPNPFNPSTRIRFRVASGGSATLRIFDVAGRLVRGFDLRRVPAGEQAVPWDGTTDSGSRLATGVYIARLDAADGAHTMKIVLMR
jgi:glucose/arabinose dehydrogenase/PKD repeat protein